MTSRRPCPPAPAPLEAYATEFDPLFARINQRQAFRQYLEGLLLPAERNKTLTALANTEPIVGAQRPEAQSLQWFLSESTWDPEAVNARRIEVLRTDPATAPQAAGILVIDEHGDRKWGQATAHVGRQYLANLGKTDNGVVSVTSLYADEQVYYPLHVRPYTPAHHFAEGKADPAFRTKLQLAVELMDAAITATISCRAVVADCFYGEDEGVKRGLRERRLGYVLALKPSHAWWHRAGEVGSLVQAAEAAGWQDAEHPGAWVRVVRRFRDGHTEDWWALEVQAGPYGPSRTLRAVVATTDPAMLPDHSTWYLTTNLPAPGGTVPADDALPAADLAEIVRLYGLRNWVEQSYKQTRGALGWSQYQVRADIAIRRHWQLVCCAFSFCWFHQQHVVPDNARGRSQGAEQLAASPAPPEEAGRGENQLLPAAVLLAGSAPPGARVAGAVDHAVALLARLVECAPTTPTPAAA
jgi:DDE superfamily endonuclease